MENPDELHDALMVSGFLTEAEGMAGRDAESWELHFDELVRDRRAARIWDSGWPRSVPRRRVAFPTMPTRFVSCFGAASRSLDRPRPRPWRPHSVFRAEAADAALAALEAEGVILRGRFTPGRTELEWCDRRLLARIHRYTLNRLRAEIAPVSTGDSMRFLFAWQRVTPRGTRGRPRGPRLGDRAARRL